MKPEPLRRRACQRKAYTSIYLVVKAISPRGMCDKDGLLLAWTDWFEAVRASVTFQGFVTNWEEFQRRKVLAEMNPRPEAMRIVHIDRKGLRHTFRAAFDASAEELRTLNQVTPYDLKHTPDVIKARRNKAKVWEET
jgi:hypothetical protein